jgi:L-rhamnose mutarotase
MGFDHEKFTYPFQGRNFRLTDTEGKVVKAGNRLIKHWFLVVLKPTDGAGNLVKAFRMQLKPGFEAEYKKRHDEIWPELSQLLKSKPELPNTIFSSTRQRSLLFAFQKVGSNEHHGQSFRPAHHEKMVGAHGRHYGSKLLTIRRWPFHVPRFSDCKIKPNIEYLNRS